MASVWNKISEINKFLFHDLSYPLTKDFFLNTSPYPILLILIIYNIFCIKIGPMLMKNRPPYNLKTTIFIYNVFQVLLSLYITYEGFVYMFSGKFNFQCQGPVGEIRAASGFQVYFLTKLIELLDTLFFVLKKSYRQITTLHLYHHSTMLIASWIGVKYFPGSQCALVGTINSLVHVFMYSYYLLSGLRPNYQKFIWWKKYVTMVQIVQFLILLIHSFNSLFYSCSYPTTFKWISVAENIIFLYLFSKFYYYNYIVHSKKN